VDLILVNLKRLLLAKKLGRRTRFVRSNSATDGFVFPRCRRVYSRIYGINDMIAPSACDANAKCRAMILFNPAVLVAPARRMACCTREL
jgi:hypothetical protein